MSPGMVAAYQIYDAARAATGSRLGAKLYTPKDLADPNSWECRLYFGDPRADGRLTVRHQPVRLRLDSRLRGAPLTGP